MTLTTCSSGCLRISPSASPQISPTGTPRPSYPQVGVDDPDRAARPAQLSGPFCQVILADGGLPVPFDLGEGRLPDVDHGRPRAVRGGYQAGITHRRPLPRSTPQRSGGPA